MHDHVYKGQFAQGERHGTGEVRHANGDVEVNQWENGKRQGRGTFRGVGGEEFSGEYHEGLMNGAGMQVMPDG